MACGYSQICWYNVPTHSWTKLAARSWCEVFVQIYLATRWESFFTVRSTLQFRTGTQSEGTLTLQFRTQHVLSRSCCMNSREPRNYATPRFWLAVSDWLTRRLPKYWWCAVTPKFADISYPLVDKNSCAELLWSVRSTIYLATRRESFFTVHSTLEFRTQPERTLTPFNFVRNTHSPPFALHEQSKTQNLCNYSLYHIIIFHFYHTPAILIRLFGKWFPYRSYIIQHPIK